MQVRDFDKYMDGKHRSLYICFLGREGGSKYCSRWVTSKLWTIRSRQYRRRLPTPTFRSKAVLNTSQGITRCLLFLFGLTEKRPRMLLIPECRCSDFLASDKSFPKLKNIVNTRLSTDICIRDSRSVAWMPFRNPNAMISILRKFVSKETNSMNVVFRPNMHFYHRP